MLCSSHTESQHQIWEVPSPLSTPALLFSLGHWVLEVPLAWKWGLRSSLDQAGLQQPLSPESQDKEALRIPGPRPSSKHVPDATLLWTCFPTCKMGLFFRL